MGGHPVFDRGDVPSKDYTLIYLRTHGSVLLARATMGRGYFETRSLKVMYRSDISVKKFLELNPGRSDFSLTRLQTEAISAIMLSLTM